MLQPYKLHAMRCRGCGASYTPKSIREYSTRSFAEDALGLMDVLGWDSAHVFGWSLGAQVASKAAAIAPHRQVPAAVQLASRLGSLAAARQQPCTRHCTQ